VRLHALPQTVSARLAPYRKCFPCQQAQHFNVWCWVLVSLLLAGSGRLKELTRWMPTRLAYWTTLRFIQAQVWDEQALLDLQVDDLLATLPPPQDGVLHLLFDTTRTKKTGEQQPLAYTTKTGKFDPFIFGHTVLLLVMQWGQFRIPLKVRVLDPKIKGHQNILVRELLTQFVPPVWCQRVNVAADAGFAAKATLQHIAARGYVYTFALPRTWKTADGRHLSNIARYTNKRCYHRVASYKPDGRRRDYWTVREEIKLTALGDVTLVISKRRFNDPPRNIKFLATNLPGASTGTILSYYARRWAVEVMFKELKSGLHLGQMQVTKKEERIQRSIALPVMAYVMLLRVYAPELQPDQRTSFFALQKRFRTEVYQEQFDRSEVRFKKRLARFKQAA
jgi:Transposase DDE domain